MSNDKLTNPAISVVIPVLNGASTLPDTFSSILEQHYSNIEIIVIDGGSSDGTLDLIEQNSQWITYWESGMDTGISNAFNRGIDKSTGDLVAILNSDDFWEKDTLNKVIQAFSHNPKMDIFHGWLRYVDSETGGYVEKPDLSKMKRYMAVYHPTMFVSRKAYNENGLYREDLKYAMDSEWCHRAMNRGLEFCEIPSVIANMRLSGISDSEFVGALREYRNSVISHNLNTSFGAYFYYITQILLKGALKNSALRRIKMSIDRSLGRKTNTA